MSQVEQITIRLPDGAEVAAEKETTPAALAKQISSSLARTAIAAKVNGVIVDLNEPIESDADVEILPLASENDDSLYVIRHSCAHVMAEAICSLFPETKLVYGPPVEGGFYYDIDLDRPLTPDDFPAVEERMSRIIKEDRIFVRYNLDRSEAMEKLAREDNPYKIDNAERAEGEKLSFYVTGVRRGEDWEDLCRGPHLPSTGKIKAFKVMSVSGAYHHGDASGKPLQRVYGTAFARKEDLRLHLERLEEAKKRDHRYIGKQLDLFSVHDAVGAGLIHWHPKGAIIRHVVETFWKDEHISRGYELVYTPHIASERIYNTSGHLEKFSEMMYSPMDIDGTNYYLKPMNCPGHYQIYQTGTRSYRDLPIRYAELGTVYRYEPSGTLHGMLRVRGFTQDDAHILCTPGQLPDELDRVLDLVDDMMNAFGYDYKAYLATRPEKSLGDEDEWEWSTDQLRQALGRREREFDVEEGGGVFYGPKIDIKLIDSIGREWQGPTVQADLQAAKRFGLSYIGSDNSSHPPVVIHRTILGSMERFIGGLIEHYGGAFPAWLAPEQVRVLTVSERFNEYGGQVVEQLRTSGFRTSLAGSGEKIGAKIRDATGQKIPYMLIIGEREQRDSVVSIRVRGKGEQGAAPLEEFISQTSSLIREKSIEPTDSLNPQKQRKE
jgi:threonyl-tRNA synthetase